MLLMQSLRGVAITRRPATVSDDVNATLPWRRRVATAADDHLQPISVLDRQRRRFLRRYGDVGLRDDRTSSSWHEGRWHVPKV